MFRQLVLGMFLIGLGVFLVRSVAPDLNRYLRISRM